MVRPDKQRATATALDASVIELDAGHGVCATAPDILGAAVRQAVDLVADAPGSRGRRLARVAERWLRSAPVELPNLAPVNPVNPVNPVTT
jgi:hypothetical protein